MVARRRLPLYLALAAVLLALCWAAAGRVTPRGYGYRAGWLDRALWRVQGRGVR